MVVFSSELELWRWGGGMNNYITAHFYAVDCNRLFVIIVWIHNYFSITYYLSCRIVVGLVAKRVVLEIFGRNLSV